MCKVGKYFHLFSNFIGVVQKDLNKKMYIFIHVVHICINILEFVNIKIFHQEDMNITLI